uniref:beta subunit of RNA polymerase n=1 Tax=Gormaniella terricola TaxID=2904618 RepID=UPI0021CC57E8|nr:beta subunit of RNA polymerase [Gormaniella terricola]UWV18268.1 beta subunit of RNA polymerase [Gormaniella terricola]
MKSIRVEYNLEGYQRTNQDTLSVHRTAVGEGTWVQPGDLLANCSTSVAGELSIGQNLLIAYMPWEGYNYEDAILISERLVFDDLHTSIHIEKYEIKVSRVKKGVEEITRYLPNSEQTEECKNLDKKGIVKLGTFVKEGDILVGKKTPIDEPINRSGYEKLLRDILGQDSEPTHRDSSLRVPTGFEAKVIHTQILQYGSSPLLKKEKKGHSLLKKKGSLKLNTFQEKRSFSFFKENSKKVKLTFSLLSLKKKKEENSRTLEKSSRALSLSRISFLKKKKISASSEKQKAHLGRTEKSLKKRKKLKFKPLVMTLFEKLQSFPMKFQKLQNKAKKQNSSLKKDEITKKRKSVNKISEEVNKKTKKKGLKTKEKNSVNNIPEETGTKKKKKGETSLQNKKKKKDETSLQNKKKEKLFSLKEEGPKTRKNSFFLLKKKIPQFSRKVPTFVQIYLAQKRKIRVGDKMAGRHGNKGIVSEILPREDMPYLPDGSPLDLVLNPLGVPSRMNVGQIYECLLGFAGKFLGEQYRITPFDESYGPDASRSFVFEKLYKASIQTRQSWIFKPESPGKIRLYDGRTGDRFDQAITVGRAYIIKLVHLVDDKMHCLTPDHDVLTAEGWLPIQKVSLSNKIATLDKKGELVYQNPTKLHHYEDFCGPLYHITNKNISLLVTLNHRMYVKKGQIPGASFDGFELIEAKNIVGKHFKYLKKATWVKEDFHFFLPSLKSHSFFFPNLQVHMNAWLTFFGLWVTEGRVVNKIRISSSTLEISTKEKNKETLLERICQVQLALTKPRVVNSLEYSVQKLGYSYKIQNQKFIIRNKQLWTYLKPLSVSGLKKSLPPWVWELSQKQARLLLEAMCLGSGALTLPFKKEGESSSLSYYTKSIKLADDVMRLALHAGWSGKKSLFRKKGTIGKLKNGRVIRSKFDLWCLSILKEKNTPAVNSGQNEEKKGQIEEVLQYKGSVFCLSVPNEVFYVRRNGLPVWTGNSRSVGPYSLITQQPLKGRSKQGGQRLGEMEVWAIEGYGAALNLLELVTIKSDDIVGRTTVWDSIIRNRHLCFGTPASFKLLISELNALCLNVKVYVSNKKGELKQKDISSLR